MPLYIRKSVSVGPFRFNLSKSGLGVSIGVKGFRLGAGPRGNYIHVGRGGLYYRQTLGRRTRARQRPRIAVPPLGVDPRTFLRRPVPRHRDRGTFQDGRRFLSGPAGGNQS